MRSNYFAKSLLSFGIFLSFSFTTVGSKEQVKSLPLSSSEINVAAPVVDGMWKESSTIGSGSFPPMNFVVSTANRCSDIAETEWQVTPSATITYDSGMDCLTENHTAARILFSSSGTYTISARVKNKAGLWSNWGQTTVTKL
ncbi:MAG: hypothetical protein ACN6ON_02235 [Sphingobacterium sp.]